MFYACLVSILFTGQPLLEMKFFRKDFIALSVDFEGVKLRNWTVNKMMTILQPPKLPYSLIQSVIETLLLSKFPPVNKRKLLYFQHDVPCSILPCSLDLDTVCMVRTLQNIKAWIRTYIHTSIQRKGKIIAFPRPLPDSLILLFFWHTHTYTTPTS